MKWRSFEVRWANWRPWFAWFPVPIGQHWFWLCRVERRWIVHDYYPSGHWDRRERGSVDVATQDTQPTADQIVNTPEWAERARQQFATWRGESK